MTEILIIIGAIFLRLVPHMPNFTPIGAVALFGGVYFNKKAALIIPLASIAISDYLLLYINPFGSSNLDLTHIKPITSMFHTTTPYNWNNGHVLTKLIKTPKTTTTHPALCDNCFPCDPHKLQTACGPLSQ